jgi:hypothetical protein
LAPVVPVNIKTVQIVGTYLRLDGTPLQGTVTLHAPSLILDPTSNVALSGDVTLSIQADGTITGTLLACDDPNTSPTGFTYQVTETFTNAVGRTYNVSLSYAAAQPIDLLALSPGSPNTGNYVYVTGPAGPAGPGVASGGTAGQLLYKNSSTNYDTSWQSPAGAGVLALTGGTMTGAVTSAGATSTAVVEQAQVTGDTYPRFQQLVSGYTSWGPGNAAGDTNLYRGAAGILKTDNSMTVLTRLGVGQNAPAVSTIAATTTADQSGIKLLNTNATGNPTGSALLAISQTAASLALGCQVNADTANRFQMQNDGTMLWGPGSAAGDTNLYRSAAGVLSTNNSLTVGTNLTVNGTSSLAGVTLVTATTDTNCIKLVNTNAGGNTSSSALYSNAQTANSKGIGFKVTTDGQNRWQALHDGTLSWGDGTNPQDTNLYRTAASTLKTDNNLTVGTTLSVGGGGSFGGALSVSSQVSGVSVRANGSTGAASPTRLVGANASGAPTSGTWQVGDVAPDLTGKLYVCTASGTPGTWVAVGGSSSYSFGPTDYGWLAWAFDPANLDSGASAASAGVLNLTKLHLPVASTITNILLSITTAPTGLTSGQNFAGLYSTSGTLLATTADQTSNWAATGMKTCALTATYSAAAGDYLVGFFANGTTPPAFSRTPAKLAVINGSLAVPRFSTGATGATTAMPSTAGTLAAVNVPTWCALS